METVRPTAAGSLCGDVSGARLADQNASSGESSIAIFARQPGARETLRPAWRVAIRRHNSRAKPFPGASRIHHRAIPRVSRRAFQEAR